MLEGAIPDAADLDESPKTTSQIARDREPASANPQRRGGFRPLFGRVLEAFGARGSARAWGFEVVKTAESTFSCTVGARKILPSFGTPSVTAAHVPAGHRQPGRKSGVLLDFTTSRSDSR